MGNALWNTFNSVSKVLIVVDGDSDPAATKGMLVKGLEFDQWISAIPNPSIEVEITGNLSSREQRQTRTLFSRP